MFHFSNKLWWAMKSGYCTIMWNGRVHGASEMNHYEPHQRPVFIQRRWCCAYGEIGMESSIMSSSGKPNYSFQQVLLPVRPAEGSTQWKLSGTSQKCIIFLQDNVRLHVSLMTRQKLTAWLEVLIHLPYSPDVAPLDNHLFWSLQNSFNGKKFQFLGRLEKAPVTVLCSKR